MAKLEDVTVQINIEGLLQKELSKVVQGIFDEHKVMIESIDFQWQATTGGDALITRCETRSVYNA